MKASVAFLVNGGPNSAMGIRAQSFAARLADRFTIHIAYRTASKAASILQFLSLLRRTRPDVCYVFDVAYSGVIAGLIYRGISRRRLIVDTGDAICELATAIGRRGAAMAATRVLDYAALHWSNKMVVRSHFHQEWLRQQGIEADVIPDGVDLQQFQPTQDPAMRDQYGLTGFTTLGLLGSLSINPRTGQCYGFEILEVLHTLKERPLKGVIIGDGDGLPHLKRRAIEFGIEDRVVFLGRIDYDRLPQYLSLMDICISTQTNDLVGQVRTTGKLPLYLATGRYVLATNVGEAARVLPPHMLIRYDGSCDAQYPQRLADAIARHLDSGSPHADTVAVSKQLFDYDVLTQKLSNTINRVLPRSC